MRGDGVHVVRERYVWGRAGCEKGCTRVCVEVLCVKSIVRESLLCEGMVSESAAAPARPKRATRASPVP